MNQLDAPQPPIDYAEQEEDTIRVKSLPDMVFPNPPDNAGQARGYINQVLMAIGKLQKTPGSDLPSLDDVEEPAPVLPPVEDAAEPVGASEPKHPLDDKLLVELGDGVPPRDEVLKREATSPEHLRTHFPKNPYCPLCHIAKDTAMRVAHVKDAKADDFVDPPKQPLEQLATDDVILAKGSEHLGVGIGGIRGDDPDKLKLPEYALKDVPFPKEGGVASPSTPKPKARSVYITVDRILKFKETPGCEACRGRTRFHTEECRARFSKLVEEEKEAERAKKTPAGEILSETEVGELEEEALYEAICGDGPVEGSDLPSLDDVEEPAPVLPPVEDAAEPVGASEPKHPLDDKLLVELGDGVPPRDEVLKREATSPEHLRTHFPKNPYCPLCHIAKDTAMRVAHVKDAKADDFVDPPKQPLEQLATDDVILAKGSEHLGVQAMVTKLLSRAEMLSNPKALEAIRAEAEGLVKAGTWDLGSVREKEEVLNSELKDLTSHFKGELQELSDKVQALEAVDTRLSQTITAVTLDSAALQSAFEETRPAVANLAAAQSALGSAQRETEKQLNASILRQKSDALALNARVKEIESGWTGLFGCYSPTAAKASAGAHVKQPSNPVSSQPASWIPSRFLLQMQRDNLGALTLTEACCLLQPVAHGAGPERPQ
eukprot:s1762_g8.t1